MENNEKIYTNKQLKRAKLIYHQIGEFKKGEIDRIHLAASLKISMSHTYNLEHKFKSNDYTIYLSKKIGVSVNQKRDIETETRIVNAFKNTMKQYEICPIVVAGRKDIWFERPTYNLFYDKIKSWCKLSKSTVISILKDHKIWSSMSRQTTTHAELSVSIVDRYSKAGEEVQLDGKVGIRFPDDDFDCVAHVAVDAKTNAYLSIFFDKQETNFGYIMLMRDMFIRHGIAKKYVTDCRSSFTTNREVGDKNVVIAKALKALCVELVTTSSAKRKNKVEQKNHVLQTRILQTLMTMNIRTMQQANSVITEVLEEVNFDLNNLIPEDNYFVELPKDINIDDLFATQEDRKIHKYSKIQYDKVEYFAVNSNNSIKYMKKGTNAKIVIYHDGAIKLLYQGSKYKLVEATYKNIKKYKVVFEFTETRTYKADRGYFTFGNEAYYITDFDSNPVPIKAGDVIKKVYNENGDVLYVMLNGAKYSIATGRPPEPKVIEPLLSVKTVSANYDGTIKLDGEKYAFLHGGKPVIFGNKSKLEIFCEDNKPTHLIHEKKVISCINLDIYPVKIHRPTSTYTADKYWPSCEDITYIIV